MYNDKICIKLNGLFVGGLLKDDFSAFACSADTVVYGGEEEHFFALLFKRVYDGGYDLIAAADVRTNTLYAQGLDEDRELLLEFIDCACYPSSMKYGEFNDIELVTPCGSMGTVIDVKIVESASGEPRFYLEGVQYIYDGEWCMVYDSSGKTFVVCNKGGFYYVKACYENNGQYEATAEIKEKVKLV